MGFHPAFQSMLLRYKPTFFPIKLLSKIVHLFSTVFETHVTVNITCNKLTPLIWSPCPHGDHTFVNHLECKQDLWFASNPQNVAKATDCHPHDWTVLYRRLRLASEFVLVFLFLLTCWLWRSKLLPVLRKLNAANNHMSRERSSCFSSWAFGWESSLSPP